MEAIDSVHHRYMKVMKNKLGLSCAKLIKA